MIFDHEPHGALQERKFRPDMLPLSSIDRAQSPDPVVIRCSPTLAHAEPSDGSRWQTAPVCHRAARAMAMWMVTRAKKEET